MGRPVIGLTTYAEKARFGLLDTFAAVLPLAYVHAVHESGGRAVLITPDDPDVDILERIDGMVFAGGSDVDPGLYGEVAHPTTLVRPERDKAELLLLGAALERDVPLLAICRGIQLMTVLCGGRLYQHLPDVLGHTGHRPTTGPTGPDASLASFATGPDASLASFATGPDASLASFATGPDASLASFATGPDASLASFAKVGEHPVRLEAGTLCRKILGDEVIVNSFHHQGIADPGRLTPAGWCPEDELLEAVEDTSCTFAVGVQWHPEDTTDFRLFEALVEVAGSRR
jgi:putative glutamine amidotransferase